MIILWVFSLLILLLYTLIIIIDKPRGEGSGVIKWMVIASFLVVIFTFFYMGWKLWLRS